MTISSNKSRVVYLRRLDGTICAYNIYDGRLYWRKSLGMSFLSRLTLMDGMLYVFSDDHCLYALDSDSGLILWQSEKLSRPDFVSLALMQPIVVNRILYDYSVSFRIFALDARSGSTLWQFRTKHILNVVDSGEIQIVDERVYVGGRPMYALNSEDGTLLWQFDSGRYGRLQLVNGGIVYASYGNRLYALNWNNGTIFWQSSLNTKEISSVKVVNSIVYVFSAKSIYALNVSTGLILWQFQAGKEIYPLSSIADGIIYALSYNNSLYALNANDGSCLWRFTPTRKFTSSRPYVANKAVYVGLDDNLLYALNRQNGSVISHFNTMASVKSLFVTDDVICCVTKEGLCTLDISSGIPLWRVQDQGSGFTGSPVIK